jgi:hypothetical protein
MHWLLLIGCIHKVQVLSSPAGALLFEDGEQVGTTPETIQIRPFVRPRYTVSLPGYRTLTFRPDNRAIFWDFLGEAVTFHWRQALGIKPYLSWELVLIPEHPTYGGSVPEHE